MGKGVLLPILAGCVLMAADAVAYTRTRTSVGVPIAWPGTYPAVAMAISPENANLLPGADVRTITAQAVAEWNGRSSVSMSLSTTSGGDRASVNTIYFSSAAYFGSGVLGTTTVAYSARSGQIVEADIALNDSGILSLTSTSSYYLGNVVTHELGHVLGLDHSEVMDSTMFYAAYVGQSSLASDDKAGVYDIYPDTAMARGHIQGEVIGSDSLIGVLGAHVEIISAKTGRVAGAMMSEADGHFDIDGLELNDTYYVYVTPPKKLSSLPDYYASSQTNFCSTGSYKGGFFSKCGDDSKGVPQGIALSSSVTTVDVGYVTLHCNFELPSDYLSNKSASPRATMPLVSSTETANAGRAMTGMFLQTEMSASSVDTYDIDLRRLIVPANARLEVKLVSQSLFSPLGFQVTLKRGGVTIATATTPSGNQLDSSLSFALAAGASIANRFSLEVSPVAVESSHYGIYFPVSTFVSPVAFYLVIANVAQWSGTEYRPSMMTSDMPYSDNATCTDAPNTYAIAAATNGRDLASYSLSSGKKKSVLSCGTLDPGEGSGPWNGPLGMVIGLLTVLGLGAMKGKRIPCSGEIDGQ